MLVEVVEVEVGLSSGIPCFASAVGAVNPQRAEDVVLASMKFWVARDQEPGSGYYTFCRSGSILLARLQSNTNACPSSLGETL